MRLHQAPFLWTSSDDITLLELARAAADFGQASEAKRLLERARSAGSVEAGKVAIA